MSPSVADLPSGLSDSQIASFWRDGYLLIPNYLSQTQCTTLLSRINQLLTDFTLKDHPMTKFVTGEQKDGVYEGDTHVGDDYFLTSGDKVRFFFEEDAFDKNGDLSKPKEKAINKIGHNLHGLVEEFGQISHAGKIGQQNAAIAKDLGYRDPRLLQSMVICKQPEIGGAVPPHQDSTFLYTDKPSAVGFWIALEDATKENGCLSFAPGSHRRAPIRERMVRAKGNAGTVFEKITTDEQKWPRGFDHEEADSEEDYQLGEVKAGTLVLIHGNILHKSEKNLSQKGRMIYTFHLIEGEEHYDDRNWLQVPGGPAAFTKLDGTA
ncbi:Phytanoyl-CoA dioxygenase domain-containing protein 1 [Cyphellophora attinorum]|uniref:Phytanoyl-CoA dioxygenase domain-containing protein 1 n=1 Tax=Cyphellophora attinorum TaxID=1664694 RepID=A0A0N1P193_9EURO|nr:Phytanoyl-CoA dioxygenase domain-containing protein 1 [Phialophora attinorum]KPI40273.1 Phytanoyl-CoA dioxygenase domain-containing protein 1 [Phialophora attinorum]